jgi:hypothetical protein
MTISSAFEEALCYLQELANIVHAPFGVCAGVYEPFETEVIYPSVFTFIAGRSNGLFEVFEIHTVLQGRGKPATLLQVTGKVGSGFGGQEGGRGFGLSIHDLDDQTLLELFHIGGIGQEPLRQFGFSFDADPQTEIPVTELLLFTYTIHHVELDEGGGFPLVVGGDIGRSGLAIALEHGYFSVGWVGKFSVTTP